MSDEPQKETDAEEKTSDTAATEEVTEEKKPQPAAEPARQEPAPVETKSEPAPKSQTAAERFRNAVGAPGPDDDTEIEIWEGGYSPKAMVGKWAACGALTVGIIVLLSTFEASRGIWMWLVGGVAVIWVFFALVLAYRKMAVHYRLTNQRFFHEHGVLWRVTDRIEVIDMDDIAYEQGPFERIFGVGTIKIHSSDKSHPNLRLPGIARVREIAGKIDQARRTERVRRGLHIANI